MKTCGQFYVLGCDDGEEGGIYRCCLSAKTGMSVLGFTPLKGASYACFSPDGKFFYSTCRIDGEGGVASFKVLANGDLKFLNMVKSNGRSACHVEATSDGKVLFVANYVTGNFLAFRLRKDGRIGGVHYEVEHEGSGPNKARQECAHVHMCKFAPQGRLLAVMDLGCDAIMAYKLDEKWKICDQTAYINPIEPEGSGPRHIVFKSEGNVAYLVNELLNTVMLLRYDQDGNFRIRQTLSTIPDDFTAFTKAAAIRLSPDEKYVYASNRGHDSIAIFKIGRYGRLSRTAIVSSKGVSPRDFNFLEDGKHVIMTNENTDNVIVCKWNPDDGGITPTKWEIRIKHPLNVVLPVKKGM